MSRRNEQVRARLLLLILPFTAMAYAPVEVFGHDNTSHTLLFIQNLPTTPVNTHTHPS